MLWSICKSKRNRWRWDIWVTVRGHSHFGCYKQLIYLSPLWLHVACGVLPETPFWSLTSAYLPMRQDMQSLLCKTRGWYLCRVTRISLHASSTHPSSSPLAVYLLSRQFWRSRRLPATPLLRPQLRRNQSAWYVVDTWLSGSENARGSNWTLIRSHGVWMRARG